MLTVPDSTFGGVASKSMKFRLALVVACCALGIPACSTTTDEAKLPDGSSTEAPESGPIIGGLETDALHSVYGMVSTANTASSRIAAEILESGGNAVDAAVAAAFAVGVSDAGDSGLGGATYILIRTADGRATAIDGSAIVPLRLDRERLAENQAADLQSGMELAAVPASLAALDYAATTYGTRPLTDLIEPAIELAHRGFHATPFHEVAIKTYFEHLLKSDYLKYFVLENGEDIPSIETLQCRPVLAQTLRRIADGGSSEFYRGSIADEIAADMTQRGGFVSRDDLGILRVRELPPLRGSYRDTEVLVFPRPSLGGAVIQALNILEQYPQSFIDQDTVKRYQVFAEAIHIATADHTRLMRERFYIGASVWDRLIDKNYATERAALIVPGQALVNEEFPPHESPKKKKKPGGNTTQISVIDRWGNAVSLTQSLGRFFGNKLASAALGFPYNSFLESEQELRAREVIPTNMCPSIVVKNGEPLLVLGSGSSSRIPGIVATVISNVVDRKMGLREAVLAPRVLWDPVGQSTFYAEILPPITSEQIDQLSSFGYRPIRRAQPPARLSNFSRFGSVNSVHFDNQTRVLTGVGDPRRNGAAVRARF
jgi:gamma-glutamyltranspeptidase/glutathione hydrolase